VPQLYLLENFIKRSRGVLNCTSSNLELDFKAWVKNQGKTSSGQYQVSSLLSEMGFKVRDINNDKGHFRLWNIELPELVKAFCKLNLITADDGIEPTLLGAYAKKIYTDTQEEECDSVVSNASAEVEEL
jgi:hypothetical protein